MHNPARLDRRQFVTAYVAAASISALLGRAEVTEAAPTLATQEAESHCVLDGRPSRSPAFDKAVRDLVVANRILAHEGVMDAFGHVSVRDPERADRFLIAQSRSPSLVAPGDIMTFRLDGTVADADPRQSYVERFIHGSIYRARPDIQAVAHSHASDVLPFTVSDVPFRPVVHSAGVIGETIPVWDIRDRFGDTNLLVDSSAKGDDLAARLASNSVVLMRGHGYAAAGRDLIELIRICLYTSVNADVLVEALRLGKVTYLSPGEIGSIRDVESGRPGLQRAWEYWAQRAGCTSLVATP